MEGPKMKQFFILSAIGKERPGIVADVTELIFESGCNLEDSAMTRLGNHFALLILLSGSAEDLAEKLARGCKRLEWDKGLTVFLSPLKGEGAVPMPAQEPDYELRVVGLDRAGIVYRTSRLLASRGINITDLHTHVEPAPDTGSPVFTMVVDVAVPQEVDRKTLRRDLEGLADQLHVEISLTKLPRPG
jgi:glycine cleavage system transcriptional repressor